MSYYYSYYLGLKTKEGLIYPIGPFNEKGKIYPIIERSRSFAPNEMIDNFIKIPEKNRTPELINTFSYDSYDNNKKIYDDSLSYEKLSDLPTGNGLRSGYFLISDVKEYRETGSIDDLFYDHMTPEEYFYRSQNEIKFGGPRKEVDNFGDDVTPHSCADYMPFAYINWLSAEYMAQRIRDIADIYDPFHDGYGEDYELVVLMTQG